MSKLRNEAKLDSRRGLTIKSPKDEDQARAAKDHFVRSILDWRNHKDRVAARIPRLPDESVCYAFYYIIGDLKAQLEERPDVRLSTALIQLGEVWIDEQGRVYETEIDESLRVDRRTAARNPTEEEGSQTVAMSRYCHECGAANPVDADFCIECGSRQ